MNGRINNLVYGSYAPGAPDVFIDDAQWKNLWLAKERYYIIADATAEPGLLANWSAGISYPYRPRQRR